jgi:UDP-3-O-[3-hydroxymyristoyl] N-acetylglucosamine deacetylase
LPQYRESKAVNGAYTVKERNRQTICQNASIKGVGLFTGQPVTMSFVPSEEKNGVYFRRLDLPGKPFLKASIENLKATPRCTILGNDEMMIQCVEHVLSAVYALGIDDLIIELDSAEPPIFDGSSKVFVEMLEKAGGKTLDSSQQVFHLEEPLYIDQGTSQVCALPSEELKFSFTIAYPGQPILSSQFHSIVLTKDSYIGEIASCRTFALHEEVKVLIEKKLLKSASLDHGVIVDGDKVLNPEGLRFENEMVRHKILDMIGDLALIGSPVCGHFIAICSGHDLNTKLSRLIHTQITEN